MAAVPARINELREVNPGASNQELFIFMCYNCYASNEDDQAADLEAARYFINNNMVNINLRSQDEDTQGETALTAASISGCIDIVRYLLDNGADINLTNSDGNTPLMCAAQHVSIDAVKLLCERGADVTVADNDGNTALELAEMDPYNYRAKSVEHAHVIRDIIRYLRSPPAAVAAAAAAAPVNDRPEINEKMDQMPNAWKEENLDDVTCPVCKGLYYKPLTFSCGHSLCKQCFGMLPGGPNKKCPECRERIGTENPKVNTVIQKRCDKLRQLAEKHFSNSNYKLNNAFGFNSPRTKGGKRVTKKRLFNSPKGGRKTRGIKYGTAANARKSIKLIRGKDKTRRKSIAMRMYYRAKYHKYQTPGMRESMKVWKKYMDSI